ncbi:MAG: hypothetical protein IH823_09375, partial [Candidatus Dadabacteria bacterium]|nr:hypothetical protein [Candidatus Dadabacteria bacterium]
MKKATSHVEWILSMSLFLISIVFILILFRPSSPEVDKSGFLDLLTNKFKEDFSTTFNALPVFVNTCTTTDLSEPNREISFDIDGSEVKRVVLE